MRYICHFMPSTPFESHPDKESIKKIHSGHNATRAYKKEQREWAEHIARDHYKIPEQQITSIAHLALKASIRNLRRNPFRAGLVKRMVLSQVVVYVHKNKNIRAKHTDPYHLFALKCARAYVRLYFPAEPGVEQEDYWDNTRLRDENWSKFYTYAYDELPSDSVNEFFRQIATPDFVLISSLEAYLEGIIKRKFFSLLSDYAARRSLPVTALPPKPAILTRETIRYRQWAHRLIDQQLGNLYSKCQEIIRRFYSIDARLVSKTSQLPDQTEPLSETEFRTLFAIGMAPNNGVVTLQTIAPELGIKPDKISDWHIDCLDELILNVTPRLFADETIRIPDSEITKLKARLEEARDRWQKKRKSTHFDAI